MNHHGAVTIFSRLQRDGVMSCSEQEVSERGQERFRRGSQDIVARRHFPRGDDLSQGDITLKEFPSACIARPGSNKFSKVGVEDVRLR